MVCIIKKDGTREEFDVQKIIRAVNKSAGRILYQFTEEEIDFLCKYSKIFKPSFDNSDSTTNNF